MAVHVAKGLLDLPFEILTQICHTWCCHCHSTHAAQDDISIELLESVTAVCHLDSTLSRLSRTCRLLNAVAQPVLYHDVCPPRAGKLFGFMRTLLQRPDLRHHVQRLNISGFYPSSDWLIEDMARMESGAPGLGIRLSEAAVALRSSFSNSRPTRHDPHLVIVRDIVLMLMMLLPQLKEARLDLRPFAELANDPARASQPVVIELEELRRLSFCPKKSLHV